MANCVYIIYSSSLDRYYVGETEDFALRFHQHNTGFYHNAYTVKAADWKECVLISCPSKNIAIRLEQFIKRMKSRKFVEQLIADARMQQDILIKIMDTGSQVDPEASGL